MAEMMVAGDSTGWDVRVADNNVVVDLPRRLALDEWESERLADAVAAAVDSGLDRVVVLVHVEHPLSAALHDALVRSARAAATEGVTDWQVVAEHEQKATAVARELPEVETAVVADEQQAGTLAA